MKKEITSEKVKNKIKSVKVKKAVILADGEFPLHKVPLELLKGADLLVCCDGAVKKLEGTGIIPDAIVGDMDTLEAELIDKYRSIIHKDPDQESNDLTKAFKYTLSHQPGSISIIGATGRREDHTIGNISLLAEYASMTEIPIAIYTDHGIFTPMKESGCIKTAPGTRISLFAFGSDVRIESEGLKYPLKGVVFDSWWKGTLNEASSEFVRLNISNGTVILFTLYRED